MNEAFPSLSAAAQMTAKKNKRMNAQTAAFTPINVEAAKIPVSFSSPTFATSATSAPSSRVDLSSVFAKQSDVKSMSEAHQKAINSNGTVRLPVDDHEAEIIEKANKNQVLIVAGGTGCGKTTRTPIFLMKTEHHKKGQKIIVTQPRRVAAQSVARRVTHESSNVSVGYAVGQDRHFDDNSELVFCTCGWLLVKLINDPDFTKQVSYFVVDEAHVRESDMDLLILVLKFFTQRFPDRIKIVLMSATLNYQVFEHYFPGSLGVVSIDMRRFPVQIAHLDTLKTASKYFTSDALVEKLLQSISNAADDKKKEDPNGHFAGLATLCSDIIYPTLEPGTATTILVFLNGIQEIDTAYDYLQEVFGQNAELVVMHSVVESDTLMRVFEPLALPKDPTKKVLRIVLSTNIAESSVTIPAVAIVIDFGKHKVMRVNHTNNNLMELRVVDISRAAADQRAGRTGRVCVGTVIRMYDEFTYRCMREHDPSEITEAPAENTILRLFNLKSKNALSIPEFADPLNCIQQLVEPPDFFNVRDAFERLISLGALTSADSIRSKITPFGTMLIRLPLTFSQAEFVLFGCQFHGFSVHFAVMASFLNNSDIWLNPNHKDSNRFRYQTWLRLTTQSRQQFGNMHDSDLLAAVEIFRTALTFNRNRRNNAYSNWIEDNGFHRNRFEQFISSVFDNIRRLGECGFSGCAEAASFFGKRYRDAMSLQVIDSILPMAENQAKACSLIIGWAWIKNVFTSTERFEERMTNDSITKERRKTLARLAKDGRTDEQSRQRLVEDFDKRIVERLHAQKESCEMIFLRLSLEVTGLTGKLTPDFCVLKILSMCLGPIDSKATSTTLTEFVSSGGKTRCNGSVRLFPQNIRLVTHVLDQLISKGTWIVQCDIKNGNSRLPCVLTITSVNGPASLPWCKPSDIGFRLTKVYDFPPRSPLHCYPAMYFAEATSVKTCFLPKRGTSPIAVTPDFTLTGKSLRVSLISLIPDDCRFIFSAVSDFAVDPHLSIDSAGQDRFRISARNFVCRLIKTETDRELAETIINQLAKPLVAKLRNWTLQDITDINRSVLMHAFLLELMTATRN